jgi:hypothetical protein
VIFSGSRLFLSLAFVGNFRLVLYLFVYLTVLLLLPNFAIVPLFNGIVISIFILMCC